MTLPGMLHPAHLTVHALGRIGDPFVSCIFPPAAEGFRSQFGQGVSHVHSRATRMQNRFSAVLFKVESRSSLGSFTKLSSAS